MGSTVTDMGLQKKASGHEIKKHAATIHCSNSLSLLQRKISNALLYHAYKELLIKEEHEITVKELCKLIAYNGNNHAVIKDALKGLLSTVIEWNVVNDSTGTEDWTASSILASVCLKGPVCLFAYSPRMKQLLHSPSMFGKINLFIQSRFKSSYGLALYENCIRYRGLGFTKWFEMSVFRKLMGVPPDIYPVFRDFKRRVLDKSVDEVNTYSDLIVEAEVLREGRQVVKIRFCMKERAKKVRLGGQTTQQTNDETLIEADELEPQSTRQYHLIEAKQNELVDKLQQYGLGHEQIQKLVTEHGEAFLLEKIKVIETSKNYKQGKVQNLAAYFLSAVKHDYQAPKSSAQTFQLTAPSIAATDMRKLQTMVKKIRKAYGTYREQVIDQAIQSLDAIEYGHFIEDFRDYAADSIKTILKLQRNKYTVETVMQSAQIKALLRQFTLRMLPDLAESIASLKKFVEDLPEKSRAAWNELMALEPNHELLKQTEF